MFITEYTQSLLATTAWKDDAAGQAQMLLDSWHELYGRDGKLFFHRAKGCEKCNQTGYKGRVGLHELLVADDIIKRMILVRAPVSELFLAAVQGGMRTLKMDGMEKVMLGLTDIKQVRAVCMK